MLLQNYLQDGANFQARAVLMFFQNFDIEESWNTDRKQYMAKIEVARWENCREQGYILTLVNPKSGTNEQLNIIFFEHRNSDNICAVKWTQPLTFNTPTIKDAEFGDIYKTKYDVSFEVSYGEIRKMSEWIKNELTQYWVNNNK